MRVFPPTRDGDKKTNVGWWIKDVERNKWYTHSILRLPVAETGFTSNSGFVEALAPESVHRAFERRLGYCRLNGRWYSSDLSTKAPSHFKLIENNTVVRFDRSAKDTAGDKTFTLFPTEQPDIPPLDKPAIEQAEAYAWSNQVSVRWRVPQNASPQLGYKLEAFADSGAKGQPLAVYEDASPHILAKRLDTEGAARSVRLTVTDIFDQQIAVLIPTKRTTPAPVAKANGLKTGLRYAYYEAPHDVSWEQLPDLATLSPVKQGVVKTLDDTIREDRRTLYAIRYTGYLRVPSDGIYVFSAGTCDGSRIRLDGKLIAENDGIHSTSQKQYWLALAKGLHEFEMDYFRGAAQGSQSSAHSGEKIAISWEGPGFELHRLMDDFVSQGRADLPMTVLTLNGAVFEGVLEDSLARIRARVERRGHTIRKVQLFADKLLLATKTGNQADDDGNIEFSVILPEGKYRVWARLWFDEGNSADSNTLDLEAKNRAVEPWQFAQLEKGGFPLGARSGDGRLSFAGEGFGFVYQTVARDFTLTGRIADVALTSKENGVCPANWLGLYILPKHGNPKVTITKMGPYWNPFGVFLTAGGQMKSVADFPDLAGGYVSIASFEEDHRWLRVVRRGPRYQAFTSADGKAWQKVAERVFRGLSKDVYAGLCFRSLPNKSRSLFQGTLDQIALKNGSLPTEVRERPREEDLRLDNRITALVQAPSDPGILYARSPTQGLLKSSDHGETWAALNFRLTTPDALAVRSVAVHPRDNSVVLRGGGAMVNGALESGLWKSKNGGTSWQLATRDVDLDGRGPTTLFGEVILFCPHDSDLVVAGGETKGLFISRDAGETWQGVALAGERITCMAFGPKLDRYTKMPQLVVGTFADAEFETLGLGKPAAPVESPGRIYSMTIPGDLEAIKPRRICEIAEFGVTNIRFDTEQNFMHFATTRGVYYTWVHGSVYSQRLHDMPTDTLFTALGGRRYSDWSNFTCASPFSGTKQSPVYFSRERSRNWAALSAKTNVEGEGKGLSLSAGVSCVLPDSEDENTLYLCNRHGIFKTTDRGKSYRLVLPTALSIHSR